MGRRHRHGSTEVAFLQPSPAGGEYDPDGVYIRRWVPELAGVPASLAFAPWKDPSLLRSRGYPEPVLQVPAKGGVGRPDTGQASMAI